MDDHHRKEAGAAGEAAALEYLLRQGLQLIARNYRCKAGEIDLVMLDGPSLALIEVRYRADTAFGGAAASVTYRKQRRIVMAARHLLMTRAELHRYPVRFDVIALAPRQDRLQVQWLKGAFGT
ncbi:MAG TPA: YraN family protein [Steroidobacteraceae bacterium]|jgi:putative endonuclease